MTAPAVQASSSQAAQAGLAAVVAAEVPTVLSHLDVHDISGTRQNLLAVLAVMVRRYGLAAATLATRQYRMTREAAGVSGVFTVIPADPAPPEQIATALRWALSGLYGSEPNLENFETKLTGAAEKLVLDTGRRTITENVQRDRRATGWARVPEPAPCSFCALLATRGAVYKEETVGFRSHDHCRCHAEPIFGRYQAPEQVQRWREIYASIPHGKPAQMRNDFRKALDVAQ